MTTRTTTSTTTGVPARMLRYTRELARDFLFERGVAIALVLGVFTWAAINLEAQQWVVLREPGSAAALARWAARHVSGDLLLLLLVTFSGLISNDRKAGYTRFLFAKPVDPVTYYGAKTLVHGTMLALLLGAWLLVLVALAQPFDPLPVLQVVGVRVFLYGGLLVLASAVARLDFLVFAAMLLVGFLLRLVFTDVPWGQDAVGWAAPWTVLDGLDRAVATGRRATLREAGYPVLYGLACFAVAMAVVRKRPLAG